MKRDMDLLRQILLRIEAAERITDEIVIDADASQDAVKYHLLLAVEAGLVAGEPQPTRGDLLGVTVSRLTWHGHEFLDAVRDDTRWNRVKSSAKAAGGTAFATLFKAAIESATKGATSALLGTPPQ